MTVSNINCCKDCPDRTVEPNCHTDCERYQAERERLNKIRMEKIKNKNVNSYIAGLVRNNKRKRR